MSKLPPDPLPALPDPSYGNELGPYAYSDLRDVCGTTINPHAIGWYKRKDLVLSPFCTAKTAMHPELEAWIADVQGFDPHGSIRQTPLKDWPMTAVIPRVSIRGESLPYPLSKGTYIIDYPSINASATKLPDRPGVANIKDRFPEGTDLLLSFFGNRAVTMGLWVLPEIWTHEFMSQFSGVMLPDFSAFNDDPWPQSLVGERMQQIFGEEGSADGVNIIPSIAWASENSLRRQLELWTSQYPRVNTIHLDCYGSGVDRTGWNWRWLFAIEKYCKPLKHIRWMISGFTTGWIIRELNDMFPDKNYTLTMSVSPYINAMVGSRDPNWQADQFRKKIAAIEDFYFGRSIADKMERPDKWPTYGDVKTVS